MNIESLCKISDAVKYIINIMPKYVKENSQIINFNKGSRIIERSNIADKVYIFCSGNIKIENYFDNGRSYIVNKNSSSKLYDGMPDFLGSIAVLAGKETYGTPVVAQTDCILIKISKENFIKWLLEDAEFCLRVARIGAMQHYECMPEKGITTVYTSKYLFIKYLIDHYKMEKRDVITIKENREELAQIICTTSRTLNRVVKVLRDNGYIGVLKGKIMINEENFKKLIELNQCME